jgi:hypothetical protein
MREARAHKIYPTECSEGGAEHVYPAEHSEDVVVVVVVAATPGPVANDFLPGQTLKGAGGHALVFRLVFSLISNVTIVTSI